MSPGTDASGNSTFRALQAAARSTAAKTGEPAPTQEYLIRHLLESFLDRLRRTEHARDFVLKGGILLSAYGVRRSTKDVDANAVSADVTDAHLAEVVHDIAAVQAADGAVFDVDSITIEEIREQSAYPGLRVRGRRPSDHGRGTRPGTSPPEIRSFPPLAWSRSTGSSATRSSCSATQPRPRSPRRV